MFLYHRRLFDLGTLTECVWTQISVVLEECSASLMINDPKFGIDL